MLRAVVEEGAGVLRGAPAPAPRTGSGEADPSGTTETRWQPGSDQAGPVHDPFAGYLADYDPAEFDIAGYIADATNGRPEMLAVSKCRKALTEYDPLLFALLYMGRHLKDARTDTTTFAQCHFEWCRDALRWVAPPEEPKDGRYAYVAPRETGKSTWWFTILPLWAAAHGHKRFAAAFAHAATQSSGHLQTFRNELEQNRLLRRDFPDLCAPARRRSGTAIADSNQMWRSRSGFTFAAKGIGSSSLGLKADDARPDLIILDDIEPGEAHYSAYQMGGVLSTVQNVVLPMNLYASVVLVGTVTMAGSIIHQLVRASQAQTAKALGTPSPTAERPEPWIEEERFLVRHQLPITETPTGEERSIWEQKWPLDFLKSIRHTRSYKLNFANDPIGIDGKYWSEDDIRYGEPDDLSKFGLFIDPAATTNRSSDFTGLAVVGRAPARTLPDLTQIPSRACVMWADEVKLTGKALRKKVLDILEQWDDVDFVYVESNVAGDHWTSILHDLPGGVRLVTRHTNVKKEIRAADALNYYQRLRVTHAKPLPKAERQMVGFPTAIHDDMVDAVGHGVLHMLKPQKKPRSGVRSRDYA